MKSLLFSFLVLTSIIAQADAWDNLTIKQASQVEKYLKKYPFIYDYCDCCNGDVYLMKVNAIKTVPCSWDAAQFSVEVDAERLTRMQYSGNGLNNYHTDAVSEEERFITYTITMNYTFVFEPKMKWAVPLFKVVPYSNNHVCKGATVFPDPTSKGVQIADAEYAAWYAKNISKVK